jgi:hypothetical protein
MLEIKQLKVMQDGFRLPEQQILEMIRFVEYGGKFTTENLIKHNPNRLSLIAITQFEDLQLFIRDGFHRTAAIILGRHGSDIPQTSVLFEDEYVIEPMTYDMFLEINIRNGWYTPFDPRTEVRKADFFDFKEEVIGLVETSKLDSTINEFILENKDRYAVPRQDHHDPFKYADDMWERINNVISYR